MNNVSWFNGFHAKLTSSPLNHDPKNLPLVYIYILSEHKSWLGHQLKKVKYKHYFSEKK